MDELTARVKGLVLDVEHSATKDGPGIRTVVFLKGCPLRCIWCHNPESWSFQPETVEDTVRGGKLTYGKERTVADVLEEVLRDKPFYDNSGGGLTVSGGEPLLRWEFVRELFARSKASGVHTAIETSGYAAHAVIEALRPVTDLWLYDIKGIDPERHKKNIGVDTTAIHANLRWLDEKGAKILMRCPMIPGVNDSDADLRAFGSFADTLKNVPTIEVEPYDAYGIDKAHKLGLKVYEAPSAPPAYKREIVSRLARYTKKRVI